MLSSVILGFVILQRLWCFSRGEETSPASPSTVFPLTSIPCQLARYSCDTKNKSLVSEVFPTPDINDEPFRLVAIGDVHGAYDGLLENLFDANITTSLYSCTWKPQPIKTILVQSGDLVDRGPNAHEAMKCIRYLQYTAPDFNAQVVRILGSKLNITPFQHFF